MQRGTIKKRFFELLILILVLLATAFLFRFINNELSIRMELFKKQAIAHIEQIIGGKISYASISPSVFMFLEVRDLRISSEAESEVLLLRLNKVRIYYNIFKLVLNSDPLSALEEINIRNTILTLDWDRDQKLISLFNNLMFSGPPKLSALTLSGSNIGVNFNYKGLDFIGRDIFFRFGGKQDTLEFDLQKANLVLFIPGDRGEEETITTSIRLRSRLDKSMTWVDSQLRINALSSRFLSLNRQTFYIGLKNGNLEITKIKDKSPIDLQLAWNIEKNDIQLLFKTENFVPRDLISFTGDWQHLNQWLKSQLTGNGNVNYSINDRKLTYRLSVDALVDNRSLPSKIHLTSSLSGDGKSITFNSLLAESTMGSVFFKGDLLYRDLLPRGFLRFSGLKALGEQRLNASLRLEREDHGIRVESEEFTLGSLIFEKVLLSIFPAKSDIRFQLSASLRGSGETQGFEANGNLRLKPSLELALSCHIENIPSDQVYELISSIENVENKSPLPIPKVFINADFSVQTDFKGFHIISPSFVLRESGKNPSRLIQTARSYIQRSKLFKFTGGDNFDQLSGKMDVLYLPDPDKSMVFDLSLNDFDYHLSGTYNSNNGFVFRGDYGVSGFYKSMNRGMSFSLRTEMLPIPINDPPVYISLDISASKGIQTDWLVASSVSSIFNIPLLESKENRTEVSCTVYGTQGNVSRLSYQDEFSSLSGNGSFEISGSNEYLSRLSLQDETNSESYALDLTFQKEALELKLAFKGSPLHRFQRLFINGRLGGTVTASGSFRSPQVLAQLALKDGRWNTDPVELSCQLSFLENRLAVSSLRYRHLNNVMQEGSGFFDLKNGRFHLYSELSTDFLGNQTNLDLSADGSLNLESLRKTTDLLASELKAVVQFNRIIVDREEAESWSLTLFEENGRLYFDGGPKNSIHGFVTPGLDFNVSLSDPIPVSGILSGTIRENQINANFSNLTIDFPLLTALIGDDVFQFLEGKAIGSLDITGLITDPDFFGTLEARGVRVGFYMAPDKSDLFNTQLVFDEKELHYGIIQTKAGLTRLSAEGLIRFSHWGPVDYDLSFWTPEDVGLHLVHDFGSVYGDGFANGRVRVRGDWNSTRVEGELQINYCRITLSEQKAFEPAPVEDYIVIVDMKLLAGRQVDFLWPSFNFPVLRTTATRGSKLAVVFNSGQQALNITGNVNLRSGEVFYFDRSFYFREGLIQFAETIGNFDPRISLRAEIRERDEINREVKIFLVVENEKLSEFSPRLTSEPALSDTEIVALLGGPIQNQIETGGLGFSALHISTDIFSQFGILRPFEQTVRETLGLDQFSIRTQVIQNVLFERILGIEEYSPTEPRSAGSYFDNTTITLGKYIGNDLFLQTLFRLYSEGVAGLQAEFQVSLEWPTPLFTLEWTIAPSSEGLKELFIRDNTFTFKWLYSY